uniref:DUF834 domain-containing protein n=1 Tax=Oryza nivara TaxID=4536 RepID=A0A0E0IRK2_ORYNI
MVADVLSPPGGPLQRPREKGEVRDAGAADADGTTVPWEKEQGSLVSAAGGGRWSEKPELSKAAQLLGGSGAVLGRQRRHVSVGVVHGRVMQPRHGVVVAGAPPHEILDEEVALVLEQ